MTRRRPPRSTKAAPEPAVPPMSARARRWWTNGLVRLITVLVAVAAVAVILLMLVFPTQAYFEQRDRIDDAEATLAALRRETTELERRVAAGTDPVVVERVAREQLSLVREGDRLYRLSVDPADAVDLPVTWPLPGVRHLLAGQ
jgi:cell division protein FtsB